MGKKDGKKSSKKGNKRANKKRDKSVAVVVENPPFEVVGPTPVIPVPEHAAQEQV